MTEENPPPKPSQNPSQPSPSSSSGNPTGSDPSGGALLIPKETFQPTEVRKDGGDKKD